MTRSWSGARVAGRYRPWARCSSAIAHACTRSLAVLVNECRGQLRRTRRELPAERGDPLDTVQQSLDRAVLHDWVWTALERLPEPQRVAVMLRHFSSASGYETIAELCGVPAGTVRSRLSAARGRLTDELLATAGEPFVDRDALSERALAGAFTDDVGVRLTGSSATAATCSPRCPPAVTQLHFHAAGRTHRLVSHYAPRPGSSRRTVPGARTGSLRGAP